MCVTEKEREFVSVVYFFLTVPRKISEILLFSPLTFDRYKHEDRDHDRLLNSLSVCSLASNV